MGFFVYTKIMYKCSDQLWDRVRAYKRDMEIHTLNDAVTDLLTKALDAHEIAMQQTVPPMPQKH